MYFVVLLGTLRYFWVLWGTSTVKSINLLFTWQVGQAQLIAGGLVVVAGENVIPFQRVSRMIRHAEL